MARKGPTLCKAYWESTWEFRGSHPGKPALPTRGQGHRLGLEGGLGALARTVEGQDNRPPEGQGDGPETARTGRQHSCGLGPCFLLPGLDEASGSLSLWAIRTGMPP